MTSGRVTESAKLTTIKVQQEKRPPPIEMVETADVQLVRRANQGDREAFGRLAARYEGMCLRLAQRMVWDRETARELAQEAMLQAWLSLGRLERPERFRACLYGIVLNVCRSYLRGLGEPAWSLEALAGGMQFDRLSLSGRAPDPEEIVEARELDRAVRRAVHALSPENREAVLLFYYEEFSLDEAAAVLGISRGAVKARLFKSRRRLQAEILDWLRPEGRVKDEARREENMISVTVADVVRRQTKEEQGARAHYVVVLMEESGKRFLPIWVGPAEGLAIALGAMNQQTPRPMTYAFAATLLEAAGAVVEEVRIESLRGDTFYAAVKVRQGERVREVDARPSDAIALAQRMGTPIKVAEEVMAKAGMEAPEENATPARRGIAELAQEWEAAYRQGMAQPARPLSEQELKESKEELVAAVFGGG